MVVVGLDHQRSTIPTPLRQSSCCWGVEVVAVVGDGRSSRRGAPVGRRAPARGRFTLPSRNREQTTRTGKSMAILIFQLVQSQLIESILDMIAKPVSSKYFNCWKREMEADRQAGRQKSNY